MGTEGLQPVQALLLTTSCLYETVWVVGVLKVVRLFLIHVYHNGELCKQVASPQHYSNKPACLDPELTDVFPVEGLICVQDELAPNCLTFPRLLVTCWHETKAGHDIFEMLI